jgi:hypothetical protein
MILRMTDMNRKQAVTVIKRMFEQCTLLEGKSIVLMQSRMNGGLSEGWQIHIKINHDELLNSYLETIAKKNQLDTQEIDDFFVIYEE